MAEEQNTQKLKRLGFFLGAPKEGSKGSKLYFGHSSVPTGQGIGHAHELNLDSATKRRLYSFRSSIAPAGRGGVFFGADSKQELLDVLSQQMPRAQAEAWVDAWMKKHGLQEFRS